MPAVNMSTRRLAHHTADGQDAAGDDAVHGGGEHHGADHVPLAGPQAQEPSR